MWPPTSNVWRYPVCVLDAGMAPSPLTSTCCTGARPKPATTKEHRGLQATVAHLDETLCLLTEVFHPHLSPCACPHAYPEPPFSVRPLGSLSWDCVQSARLALSFFWPVGEGGNDCFWSCTLCQMVTEMDIFGSTRQQDPEGSNRM